MSIHFHPLRIREVRQETPESISVSFEIPENLKDIFQYTHGQNVTLRTRINEEEIRRSYSICSAPYENEFRVAIKRMENGKFSNWANNHLKARDVIDVLPPTGRFTTEVSEGHKKNYLAFVAGSGITPVLSILKTILHKEPHSEFTLVYGNRNRSSILFKEELEGLKNRYLDRLQLIHVLSRERAETPVNAGRINTEKFNTLCSTLINLSETDEVFLCGPEQLIFSLREALQEKGFPDNKIHFELFTTPGQLTEKAKRKEPESEGAQSKITIKLDGITFDFPLAYNGHTILDAALQNGADLPYACKGGVCCTCRAKLMEGEVEMDVNYALEEEEIKRGFILTCQSHPRTEKVVIDFDQR